MTEGLRQAIAEKLRLFPEVRWDRFVEFSDGEQGSAFGWIARDDGRSDFMRLEWVTYEDGQGFGFGFSTSSAEQSAEFARRLYGEADAHVDCQRVEDRFGDLLADEAMVRL